MKDTGIIGYIKRRTPLWIRLSARKFVNFFVGIKQILQKVIYVKMFNFWERLGFHITPSTFGSTIPELLKLPEDVFYRQSSMVGISINEESQLQILNEFKSKFGQEMSVFEKPTVNPWDYCLYESSAFPPVDAQILYCMVRHFGAKKYFEFGSGKSTCIAAKAALKNLNEDNLRTDVIAFEPYPGITLKNGFPGLTRLVEKKAEEIPLSTFSEMEDGDIIFIDSTHHMRIGSDLNHLYLEVLPRLPKGVLVHIHDIFLPAEYPKLWVKDWKVFPNEQYLLHAFLLHNSSWEIIWASHFMHLKHPEKLEKIFSAYTPNSQGPGSFWIRRI